MAGFLNYKRAAYLLIINCMWLFFTIGCANFTRTSSSQHNKDINLHENNTSLLPWNQDQEKASEVDNDPIEPVCLPETEKNTIDYLSLIPADDDLGGTDIAIEKDDSAGEKIQSKLDEALDFYQASQDFWQKGELDNALQALDQAYALITEVVAFDLPELNQQKDDLRFMISKRILEIYASRHITAKGNHNAIPLIINEHVQKEIDRFTDKNCRDFFINSYKRSGRYRQYIISELKKAGLPEELSWLPLIESGFKVNAMSSARALGLWQFISSTGHKFGLKRDLYIDERLDPYKSTLAAIEYLKELHEIFGDWMTVLAAYNCGEGRVLRTIRKQNINYLDDFWDLYQRLPRETARYVPKFMAALHIINNLEAYDMKDIIPDPPMDFEILMISKQVYLKDIAKIIHLPKQRMIDLNPELRYKLLPPEEYPLKIPADKKELLLASIKDIPEYVKTRPGIVYHRVRPGETLSTIARRYSASVNQIAKYNNIYRKNYIVAGKILKIPQAGKSYTRSGEARIVTYRVRRGDSLWILAKRYDTTTKKIQEFNNLKTVNLHIGQVLSIPSGPTYGLEVYRVKRGDTPFIIAKQFNMDLNRLLRLNNLEKNSIIHPGQPLYVK